MKEELTIKQFESLNNTLEKSSADLEKWQGRSDELSEKFVSRDKEISAIKNNLVQKANLLNIELANIDILTYQLSEKDKIINQMKATYELNNAIKGSKARASKSSGKKIAGFIHKLLSGKQLQLTSK